MSLWRMGLQPDSSDAAVDCFQPEPTSNPMRPIQAFACLLILLASACVSAAPAPQYRVEYVVGFAPADGEASVRIRIEPGTGAAQRLRFSIDPERHSGFEGDGRISRDGEVLVWRPGPGTAELRYRYKVDRERNGGAFVARMTPSWTLLRIDRLIPPVAVLAPGKAQSRSSLRFELPAGWSSADVAYRFNADAGHFPIDNPGRRFQRPLGWMIAGDLGIRREQIDEMEVAVAAPRGATVRRNDVLAVIHASALELRDAFGRLPTKLLIVGAGDPMWRGGLSGPNSLFLHADRPMISENGTSTLLHEIAHVIGGIRGEPGDDWIAEGIAEFYSIEMLRRTGLISEARAERAFNWMRNRGRAVKTLHAVNSSGPRTARAVVVLRELDLEVRKRSGGAKDLDDVIRPLVGRGRISPAELRESATSVIGEPPRALDTPLLKR